MKVVRLRAKVPVPAGLVGTLVLAGCQAPQPAAQAPAGTAAPEEKAAAPTQATAAPAATAAPGGAAAAPTKGGTLRVVQSEVPGPQNPHLLLGANYSWLFSLYDTLTRYDTELNPQPRLAEKWDWNSERTQLQLTLRKGVQFHTGRGLPGRRGVEPQAHPIRRPVPDRPFRTRSRRWRAR